MINQDTRGRDVFGHIRHYYGDLIRQFFVGLAILIAICTPFSQSVPFGVAVGIPTVLILVILAGLTSPRDKIVLLADAVASILGVVLGEWYALGAFTQQAYIPFAVLEFISAVFLVCLYFSIKTVRSMEAHMIGRSEPPQS